MAFAAQFDAGGIVGVPGVVDRLFGRREQSWLERKQSVLDTVREDFEDLNTSLGKQDQIRLEEHLASVRDLERSIASLPPEYAQVAEPEIGGDTKDYPRIAKLQSYLVVHALANRQTRVATYMLTKCQSLVRLPQLGYTTLASRLHAHQLGVAAGAAHSAGHLPMARGGIRVPAGTHEIDSRRRRHAARDHCCLLCMHEHAEANIHKNNGLIAMVAGHVNGMTAGVRTRVTSTMGELYLGVANDILKLGVASFPTASSKLEGLARGYRRLKPTLPSSGKGSPAR